MSRAPNSRNKKKQKKASKPAADNRIPGGAVAAEPKSSEAKPSQAQPSFDERRQAERQKRNRSRRRRKTAKAILILMIPIVLIGVFAGQAVFHYYEERSAIDEMTSGSCKFDRKTDPGATGQHVTSPTFAVNPPSGGLHTLEVASEGDYSGTATANLPSEGQLVHALEHGFINIWFRPDISAEDLTKLKELRQQRSGDVLLIPRPSMPVPYAATAWHERLLCEQLEPDKLLRFVEFYNNKGPEKVR